MRPTSSRSVIVPPAADPSLVTRRRLLPLVAVSLPAAVGFALAACATAADTSLSLSPPASGNGQQVLAPSASATSSGGDPLDAGVDAMEVDAGHGDYTYGDWSGWSNCSETCDAGVKTRTRACKRADGVAINCTLCGGQCTETQACSASICCAPREVCCPVLPYNVITPTLQSCTDTLVGFATKCLDAGCQWTGATECTIGGSPSIATLPGGEGTCQ